jgi:apolipoprotein N-acyltransferase
MAHHKSILIRIVSLVRSFLSLSELYPFFAFLLYWAAFPYLNWWPLAWVCFVPYFIYIKREDRICKLVLFPLCAFLLPLSHFYYGMSFFSFSDYLFFIVGLSISIVPFTLAIKYLMKKTHALAPREQTFLLLLGIPSVWTVYEYARGSAPLVRMAGGALTGYSQIYNLPFLQIAGFIGGYGLGFLVVLFNTALFLLVACVRKDGRKYRLFPLLAITLIILLHIIGGVRLFRTESAAQTLRVSLIQPNVLLSDYNQAEGVPQDQRDDEVTGVLFELIERAARESPDLIILPERSYPRPMRDTSVNTIFPLARRIGIPIIVGALYEPDYYESYNSAYLVSATGEISERYDKIELYPLGEYIPGGYVLENLMNKLEVHKKFPFAFPEHKGADRFSLAAYLNCDWLRAGTEQTIFTLDSGVRFAVPICAEDVFPELVRQFVEKDAQFIAAIINEAWFGKAVIIEHHLACSLMRAVENNVPLVRATNTAYTGLILPNGKMQAIVTDAEGNVKNARGYSTVDVPIGESGSFYTRTGFVFPIVITALAIFFIIFAGCLPKEDDRQE